MAQSAFSRPVWYGYSGARLLDGSFGELLHLKDAKDLFELDDKLPVTLLEVVLEVLLERIDGRPTQLWPQTNKQTCCLERESIFSTQTS